MTSLSYLDASAIAKLILEEPESAEMLRWYVEAERVASNRIGVIETRRAVARRAHDPARVESVLRSFTVLEIDEIVSISASAIEPPVLRTLDAIHVASALALGAELGAFVTYDDRLAAAARIAGLPVVRPA